MSKSKRKLKPLSAKLISLWHPTLNGDLRPEDVSGGCDRVVWFLHYDEKWKQWHEWDAEIGNMSRTKSQTDGCPICSGTRLVVGLNDLATRNPIIADMWHPMLNGALTPQMVTEHSNEMRYWQHKDIKTGILHDWPMVVANLTSKKPQECSICSGQRIQVGANDLVTTHSVLASEWHPTLNGELTPQMITRGSKDEVWWQKVCFGVRHEWHATPKSRTGKKLQGCAICTGRQIQLGVNDLASQRPDLALEWDHIKNGKLTPQMVTVSGGRKVRWKHKAMNGSIHRWPARIYSRTGANKTGCPKSECAQYGFDFAKPGHVYVLAGTVQGVQVIQFGISNDIKTRLARHRSSGFTNPPIATIPSLKGVDARTLECSLLNLLREHCIPSCSELGVKFPGSTESFLVENAVDNEDFLEEFQYLVGLS